MSSTISTPAAVAAEGRRWRGRVWRAVEAQHVVSTRALVDTLDEQNLLEALLDEGKPRRPAGTAKLHYLLFTPFRYRPSRHGSRFRAPNDPGVFYAADEVRTACAELGYWRWRHLADSPSLASMPVKPQTVFRVSLAASAVDLRAAPFAPVEERREAHFAAGADQLSIPIGKIRMQHQPAIEKRRILRRCLTPVCLDRFRILDLEGMRRRIEPHLDRLHRNDGIPRKDESHDAPQTISSVTATGQWSEAFGRSQPTRG